MKTTRILFIMTCGLFLLLFLLLLNGCGEERQLDAEAYISWVENKGNGLKKVKEAGDFVYELQYWPVEYKLLKESETRRLGRRYVEKGKRENDSTLFFRLRVYERSRQRDVLEYGVNNMDDYYRRLDYMSYGFEENLACVSGEDTLLPRLYHFERTYSVSPFADMLFTFKEQPTHTFTVLVDDVVFGAGPLKFEFTREELGRVPELATIN